MIVKRKLPLYKIFCTLKKIPPPVVVSYEKNLKITKENKIVKNTFKQFTFISLNEKKNKRD